MKQLNEQVEQEGGGGLLTVVQVFESKYPKVKDSNHIFLHGVVNERYNGVVIDKKKREEPTYILMKDILTGKETDCLIERIETDDTEDIEKFIKKYRA